LAIAAFKRAIEADADFTGSYSNLALIYEDRVISRRRKLSCGLRSNAIRRTPPCGQTTARYSTSRKPGAGKARAGESVAADPTYASAHNNLGAVYGKLGQAANEIASYRKAASLDPGYADARHNLGLALLRQGP